MKHFNTITGFLFMAVACTLTPMATAYGQETEERIKPQETTGTTSDTYRSDLEDVELPPLSMFLAAVAENATVKRAQSQTEEIENEYRLQKRDWWNFIHLHGMYGYGRYNLLNNNSNEYTPMYQSSVNSAQHNFNIGASVNISLGDLINRPLKQKGYRKRIEQLKYAQEEVMEERKLKILEAYNTVTEQLATIKAKAETAALYNAQMKISEYNFIQGKIDIASLAIERARRADAVTIYEQSRVELHNSIIRLELLTNIKIIKDE